MTVDIGAISYGAATFAFALLTVLFLVSWRGKLQGGLLVAAAAVTTSWAGTISYGLANDVALAPLAVGLEFARDGFWLAFLYKLIEVRAEQAGARHQAFLRRAFHVGMILLVALGAASVGMGYLPPEKTPGWGTSIQAMGLIGLALAGIALIEQLYRNAEDTQRWALKYFCLGLGALFAYDFYLYSEALLFKRIDSDVWTARGIANALVVPLLAVSAARNPQWSLSIHVSRRMVFHTTTLLGGGVYLLLMAAAGYYIRFFGGTWGNMLQSVFFFGALVILATVVFSSAMRAKLKVFLSKHFFSYKYDYREEWLRFTRTLSEEAPGVSVRERSLRAVASLVDSPAAALWMEQEDGHFGQVAQWNLPATHEHEASDSPLCRFLRERQWVINVPEYDNSPDMYNDLELPTWLRAAPGAWLVVPLMMHDALTGFIVLAKPRTERSFNWEDSDLLKTAGRQVAVYLAQIRTMEALSQARQFESFNRFSAFVVHDLKNLVAQLSLMLKNAEKHKHNPAFQEDMLATVGHATQKMNRLLSQLRAGYQTAQGASLVNLAELLAAVVASKHQYRPTPSFVNDAVDLWVLADKERLARVLGHLVQNAIEATPDTGEVAVTLSGKADLAVVEVRDTGKGMDEEFIRNQLFRPFSSTKSAGMGIGAYECREYVQELKGDIRVESRVNAGTVFTVSLPSHAREYQEHNELPMQGAIGG